MNEARNLQDKRAETVPALASTIRCLIQIGRDSGDPAIRSRTRIVAENLKELARDPNRPGLRALTLRNVRTLSEYRARVEPQGGA